MYIFRKFASMKNSKGVIGELSDSDLHYRRLAEVRPCEWPHTPFMEGPESFKSLHNMLLTPASPTSSQLNVNSIISSQIPLCKIFISILGIIPVRCGLIYMLRPIDTIY